MPIESQKRSAQENFASVECRNSRNRCCNKGSWIKEQGHDELNRYIPLDADHDSKIFVSRFLKDAHPKSWLFVGDSTMRKMYDQLVILANCRLVKRCETPCSFDQYLNMENNFADRSPNESKLCVNSGDGCNSQMHLCKNSKMDKVEFIRQLYSGPLTNFAVDSFNRQIMDKFVHLHMYLRNKPKSICVLNIGMHGLANAKRNDQTYVDNIRIQLSLLNDVCERILWLSLNYVLGDTKYKQKNERILKWNGMVDRALQSQFPEIGYIDMFPMSTLQSMHADNVHMNVVYYQEVAKLFLLN